MGQTNATVTSLRPLTNQEATFDRQLRQELWLTRTTPENAAPAELHQAIAKIATREIGLQWADTHDRQTEAGGKNVAYLSIEFLLGRSTSNNLMNGNLKYDAIASTLAHYGHSIADVLGEEADHALGNGGLGRLAACYASSAAALHLPFVGYSILYKHGLFAQEFGDHGQQLETPDSWLKNGDSPWLNRTATTYPVRFGGYVETLTDFDGRVHYRWAGGEIMNARAVDMPVVGAPDTDGQSTVNTLRLWDAEPVQAIDFAAFSRGDHHGALSAQTSAAALTAVLYPEDSNGAGKALRLRQQHFMVSATVQDLVARHEQRHGSLDSFADKNALQINDTHPALAIPELMRVLMDDKGMSWDKAWGITQRTVAYTNHTLLPEALEKWDGGLFRNLLPRHYDITCEINRRFLLDVNNRLGLSGERDERISILGQDGSVRMGNLAVVGSHSVNGVAKLHSGLVKSRLFPDYAALWPERFGNVTNGVTTDRWIEQANPGLTSIFNSLAHGWQHDPARLAQQAHRATETALQESFAEVKLNNKQNLADHIQATLGLKVNPEALFDVQIKRQHEYKRQLLNVLHIADMYDAIVNDRPHAPCVPVVKIIAGKAAPGYYMAKLILQLANAVAHKVNSDPRVGDRLKVVVMPNYSVSLAEKIVPAANLSEQISTAGTEASGTGNMKMSMNGALTIGTLDGANVEIREAVGAENFFLFGQSTQEVERTLERGYNSAPVIRSNQRLERAISLIDSGDLAPLGEPHRFGDIVNLLYHHDRYLVTADFASYMEAQHRAQETYADKAEWGRMSVTNALNTVGPFSSTRAIQTYAQEIWHTQPVPPAPRAQAGIKAAVAGLR